jgi:hypothetical protein
VNPPEIRGTTTRVVRKAVVRRRAARGIRLSSAPDREVKAADLLGRHRDGVVASDDESEVRVDVVDRCRREQQDALEAGGAADGAVRAEGPLEPERIARPTTSATWPLATLGPKPFAGYT